MAVPSPNLHLTTNQGGYCLCWETNDVKHLLKNTSTDCNKPSLQTSAGTDTPITLVVGALWVSTGFFPIARQFSSRYHLGKVSGMYREGRARKSRPESKLYWVQGTMHCVKWFTDVIFYFLYSRFLLVIHFIHISVYMSIPIAQFITPPPPRPHRFPRLVSIHLFSTSVSQLLPCKPVHLYHFSRFHIYALMYNICFSLSD